MVANFYRASACLWMHSAILFYQFCLSVRMSKPVLCLNKWTYCHIFFTYFRDIILVFEWRALLSARFWLELELELELGTGWVYKRPITGMEKHIWIFPSFSRSTNFLKEETACPHAGMLKVPTCGHAVTKELRARTRAPWACPRAGT